MKTISREQLKAKLDLGSSIKLVMALSEYDYRTLRIPGSLHFNSEQEALSTLNPEDEIILYCTDALCPTARVGYSWLTSRGYQNVSVYEGGIADWEAAGYPLEGGSAR
jgi:rhodanese-related sulfurtransferase